MPMSVEMSEPQRVSGDITAHPPPAIDIFGSIDREVGILDGFDHIVLPHNLNSETVAFRLEPDHVHYIQPNKTRLYCKFKIVRGDGAELGELDNVNIVNLLPAALFKTCQLSVNDMAAGGTDLHHLAYKSILETMSSYDEGAVNTHLQNSLFYPDTAGQFDSLTNENKGYQKRKALIAKSKTCEFITPLNLDVLSVDKLFPPGLKLNVTFIKNDPKWFLLSNEVNPSYNIKFEALELIFRKIRVSPTIYTRHEQALMRGSYAKYPYKRNVIKKMFLNTGERTIYWQNAFNGALPSQLFMVMNKNSADLGDFKLNPFNFQHFDLARSSLTLDGRVVETYQTNFDENEFAKMLYAYYENIGIQDYNGGCSVDRKRFSNGSTIVSWNLIADKKGAMFERFGGIDLHLEFKKPLAERVTVILWGIYDDVLRITPDKRFETSTT